MEGSLTTADVYETASLIGKDMEQIMENYGHEVVVDIMPKIITVLEQLEVVVGEQEKGCLDMEELRLQNERLLTEVKKEASHRRRLDEEFYQYKQSSTREIAELNKVLESLKETNESLLAEEQAHKMKNKEEEHHLSSADLQVLSQMKMSIDDQRDVIRSKNSEVERAKEDIEAMEEQVERLVNINESIRRNLTLQKSRNATLAQEKADIEADNKMLQQHISKGVMRFDATPTENSDRVDGKSVKTLGDDEDNETGQKSGVEPAMVGSKDPNRPRFTLKELQKVLKERNELKEEVITLTEDLTYYKTREDDLDSVSLELHTSPNEKPRPKQKSGISKFFKFFRKEESRTGVIANEEFVIFYED